MTLTLCCIQLGHHWLRYWPVTCLAISHYTNKFWHRHTVYSWPLIRTNFREIWIKIQNSHVRKLMHLKMSSNFVQQCSTYTFHGTRLTGHFEKILTSNTHNSYMATEIFTRPKHDFTHLGRVDGWLGRTRFRPQCVNTAKTQQSQAKPFTHSL